MKDSAKQIVVEEKNFTQYKKGELIFKEGTRAFGIFCLNKGKVKLVKSGEDGRSHILRLHRAGDLVGYRSLFSESGYNASAIAIEDCSVCFIARDVFTDILKNDPKLCFEVLELLSEDLRKADLQITNINRKPVRERVAEALLFIHETYGFAKDGKSIDATFSREDLANLVGTATETIIRVLSDLNKEGLIVLKGKKIEIPELERLAATAKSIF